MSDGFDELRDTGLPQEAARELARELRRMEREGSDGQPALVVNVRCGQPRSGQVMQAESKKVLTIVGLAS